MGLDQNLPYFFGHSSDCENPSTVPYPHVERKQILIVKIGFGVVGGPVTLPSSKLFSDITLFR